MANCVVCSVELDDGARFCPACGAEQPQKPAGEDGDDPFIGQVINRNFRIDQLLGVGGMGKVYKARQLSRQCQQDNKMRDNQAQDIDFTFQERCQ